MKLKAFNCVVFALKTNIVGDGVIIGPGAIRFQQEVNQDLATFIVLAEDAAEAERLVLERYKYYPDKFEYDKIYVYSIGFRSEKFFALLKGEVLELAQGRMEVFDELDAEIIG